MQWCVRQSLSDEYEQEPLVDRKAGPADRDRGKDAKPVHRSCNEREHQAALASRYMFPVVSTPAAMMTGAMNPASHRK